MIVVDSSVLLAIVLDEAEAQDFARRLATPDAVLVSAATVFEASMVAAGRRDMAGIELIDRLLSDIGAFVVPFDARQAQLARETYIRYGKGRHKAALNFGDCMTYALAKTLGVPLLFKGTDFAATDIAVA